VSLLDHGDVIASVTDTGNSFAGNLLDFLRPNLLLFRTAPTHAYRLDMLGLLEEPLQNSLIARGTNRRQRRPINHQHDAVGFAGKGVDTFFYGVEVAARDLVLRHHERGLVTVFQGS